MKSRADNITPEPSRRRAAIPEIAGLDEMPWWLHRSIEVLEEIYCGVGKPDEESWLKIDFAADQSGESVREELLELVRAPYRAAYMNQSVAFWRLVESRRDNVCHVLPESQSGRQYHLPNGPGQPAHRGFSERLFS